MEIILAQFGPRSDKIEPSYGSLKSIFPDASFKMYSDTPHPGLPFPTEVVQPPYDRGHPRYGYRCNDLYKAVGLLESTHDVSMAIDNDMWVFDPRAKALVALTERFGMCLPANPRLLVKVDTLVGEDSDRYLGQLDQGTGYAVNMSPITLSKKCKPALDLLIRYTGIMRNQPVRGPLAMWRAIWMGDDFFNPYILPPQWCVCAEDVGVGDELILHVGHEKVANHYGTPR